MIDYNYELELYIILIITQFKNYRLEDHPHSVDRTPTQGSKIAAQPRFPHSLTSNILISKLMRIHFNGRCHQYFRNRLYIFFLCQNNG